MRIGLIGDTHGFVPALEAAVEGCKDASVDTILHCGDFLTAPFSPDPHDESIALLRAEGILAVYGNAEAYLMHWDTDVQFTPVISNVESERVLSRPTIAGVDLILCGYIPYPLVLRRRLPNGRTALVVRGTGWMKGNPDGSGWMVDYWILENRGPAAQGFRAWTMQRCLRPFKPRNPGEVD